MKVNINHLTNDDIIKTREYLLRHLRDYVSLERDEPEHIEIVCRIMEALRTLEKEF